MQRQVPKWALKSAAVGAAALLGLIVLTAHTRRASLLQAGKLEAFLPEAERQLLTLQHEMPGGRVAQSFPREERELSDLYARTEKGLKSIDTKVMLKDKADDEAAKQLKKKAVTVSLAATSQRAADKQNLAALVNKAGSTMYMLEHQLPAADRKMFPKEASELQAAFGVELNKLAKIRKQLLPEQKKAQRVSLAARSGAMPGVASSKQLDQAKAADDKENHAMAGADDLNDFFGAVNGPSQPKARKAAVAMKAASPKLSMLARAQQEDRSDQSVTGKRGDIEKALPSAKKVARVLGLGEQRKAAKGKKGKGKGKATRAPSLTPPQSSIQKWGTVFDPTLSWGKMPQQVFVFVSVSVDSNVGSWSHRYVKCMRVSAGPSSLSVLHDFPCHLSISRTRRRTRVLEPR